MDSLTQDKEGYYIATLPWNENKQKLHKNTEIAKEQARALIRRMVWNEEVETLFSVAVFVIHVFHSPSRLFHLFGFSLFLSITYCNIDIQAITA